SITFLGAEELWASEYLPLVEAMIADMAIDENVVVASGVQVGQAAPEFSTVLLDGTPVSLSDYRGKIVLINFWATWCPPCRFEMPEFERIYTNETDVVILAVNMLETPELIQPYVDELGLTF